VNILDQVGGLLLQAVPTIVILYLFYFFLKANLFRPLERILDERSARIEGARRESESYLSAAHEKEKAYQEALKKARAEIYAEQDALRRKALDARAAAVRQARSQAQERITGAKARIAADAAATRAALEREAESIAAEIARAILKPRPRTGAGKEAR
jgi:F-type H+-transporting ATPase subunit b